MGSRDIVGNQIFGGVLHKGEDMVILPEDWEVQALHWVPLTLGICARKLRPHNVWCEDQGALAPGAWKNNGAWLQER